MRLKSFPLIIILIILSFTNSHSQIWTRCQNGICGSQYGVDCLAKQDSILFASPTAKGIYKSTDNGVNWFFADGNLGNAWVFSFYVNGPEIFACTSDGLYSTTDYGQNWNPRGFNTGYTIVGSIIKSGANLVLALEYSTVYYSTNNGLNWLSCAGVNIFKDFIIVGNTLYAASAIGVYASTDDGITWQSRSTGIAYGTQALSDFNGILYAGGNGIYRTYDNGLNWIRCDSGISSQYATYSLTNYNGSLFAGTDGGIYKSTNGSAWIKVGIGTGQSEITNFLSYNSRLFATSVYGNLYGLYSTSNNGQNWNSTGFEIYTANSIVENNNNIIVSTDTRGVYSSSDYGDTWYMANLDMKSKNVLCLAKQYAFVFAGTRDSGIYKSSNNGQNWVKSNSGLSNYSIKSLYTKDSIIYCGTNSGVYNSTNSGQNWNLIGLQNTTVNTFYVFNNYYFAGTNNGIRISSDGGANWTANLTSDTVISFYNFSGKLIAGTFHGVKVSTDYGNNWVSIGLTNSSINSITNMADTLVTSTNLGVFATTNMGNNWINLGPKEKTCGVIILNNKIYAGGVNCVWKKDANVLTGVSIISTIVPDKYLLHQNYPNPFNPSTKIKFDIPKTANTKLTIFDITGREVKVLVNDILQPGTYESNWNADNLSSGIYFYKLTTQNFSETKKMLLLK